MRISTANRYDATVDSLQRRQRDMAQAQEQMTNGKRINQPSDDPTGAARAERAYLSSQRITSSQRSVDASRNAMVLAEAALGQSSEVLQSAREALVAAGNGSYSGVLRAKGLAVDSQGQGQLLQVAGGRWAVTPAAVQGAGRLVLIGLRERWNPQALLQGLLGD